MIVGREEGENKFMEGYRKQFTTMRCTSHTGPLVLIDGVEATDPSSPAGAVDFSNLWLDNIERIEVVRGPQSTLYGSDAIGGVINIITKAAADTTGTRVYAGFGDKLEAFGGARHGFTLGDYRVLVLLSEASHHELRMSDLADQLQLSPSGLTRRLDGLVADAVVKAWRE